MAAFEDTIRVIENLGYAVGEGAIPFGNPGGGLENIEEDRKTIAEEAFGDFDVLLLPTIPATVPTVRDASGNPQALSPENTVFANYYGLPAISVPCGFDTNGLPVGLQMVARPWDEISILKLASRYQVATPWNRQHPGL